MLDGVESRFAGAIREGASNFRREERGSLSDQLMQEPRSVSSRSGLRQDHARLGDDRPLLLRDVVLVHVDVITISIKIVIEH